MTLRVLTLSTLFPDMTRPNFGVFVERQCRELASREGIEMTVIAPIGVAPWPFSLAARYAPFASLPQKETWRDLTVYRPRFKAIPKFGGSFHVKSMTRAIWPLVRRLHAEKRFDVIDASFFWPDGPVAQRIASRLGIPYSVKARGADIHYWGRLPSTRKAVREVGQIADGLLAVSEAMQRSMVALGMDEEKIRIHYTGVDLASFAPQDRNEAKAFFGLTGNVILCVGSLIPRKGQDILIRALADVPDATLLLAGHGPERSNYKQIAVEAGVESRVGFLGAVPHFQLPILYNAADVMALPSESEGLANAWVESLACGTPILISDVGGARELLTRPAAGRIVDRSPQAFATALNEMLAVQPDRIAVRKAAMRFSWRTNTDVLYEHLLKVAKKERVSP